MTSSPPSMRYVPLYATIDLCGNALEKLAHYQIVENLKSQEQARLADKLERALRQPEQTSARFSLRGVLRVTLGMQP